ncbi:integrase catalytic domain-containing protein [Trichonephila inaurata madagascariensis]|uniref:Integrase catalytic domain-containing protein n=1 Tax=Trichonephila inaurata madagascariensis TaxID=2747483 RepID=A0A8X6WV12_9ARAC|nr:integrase catalytic domain-containing protein [Trichonephila inaurata madagascariensis]
MATILNLITSVIEVIRRTLDSIHNAVYQDLHLITQLLRPVRNIKTSDRLSGVSRSDYGNASGLLETFRSPQGRGYSRDANNAVSPLASAQVFHPVMSDANNTDTGPNPPNIEACLNSRPLTELSPDPSDFNALTPAHFLVGGPIHQFPEPSQPSRSVALSERWNLIQRLRQYFWDRWSTEYLHRLQPRSKWWKTKPNLKLGDMVIVEKEETAPLNWTLGRINKLFFGPDQKVRVVSVNTKYGQLTRNVNKIYLLPNSQEI